MGRIPLEDNFDDVINKAQRGLGITDEQLCTRAEVLLDELRSLKSGTFIEGAARRVAAHLRLHRDSLVQLANKTWYPKQPIFPNGFAAFNTPMGDITVNSYVIWDERSRTAAAFDTGATCEPILELVRSEHLQLRSVFITHSHDDHIADLTRLAAETKAEVWASGLEPLDFPGAKSFSENAFFHVGPLSVKALYTPGHAKSGASYYVMGLSYPLIVVGDAVFSCSMGGAPQEDYNIALHNIKGKILNLSADTVLACGHGPVTTVGQERRNNPFFAR